MNDPLCIKVSDYLGQVHRYAKNIQKTSDVICEYSLSQDNQDTQNAAAAAKA